MVPAHVMSLGSTATRGCGKSVNFMVIWRDRWRHRRAISASWLTYNASEYNAKGVLPRHGLAASDDASKDLATFPTKVTDLSTQ
jgi:hypothetical protein